jgi:hypothetical protein
MGRGSSNEVDFGGVKRHAFDAALDLAFDIAAATFHALATESMIRKLPDGTRKWYRGGKLHRTDGPAIEYADGTREWYRNGKIHRADGPAVERADGTSEWYRNGKLQRVDIPEVKKTELRQAAPRWSAGSPPPA